ncbi:hypothetical protein OM076_14205 [Solirubrobacter ginsenosidimutans]|uniref:Fibronectin type-III domain-containing protein n=1 Tax=Solirubrobacter ginsenosidimutans TaxID=490573 RepID=A0A9X3MT79_9ACTN|nr:hypothetical protein [Solirubrobacter ginsenosidimutans]MDA0161426.1 hypothetical protein [Solirubrobacter ginsenosidimutans]
MLRTLLALAGLLLLAPATASAGAFGELPFHAAKDAVACLQATGSPGELVYQTRTSAQVLSADATGLTPGVTLPTEGAVDCAHSAAWPGGGGLLSFPLADELNGEVWVRGFLREPGQGWGEAIEIFPPRTRVMTGAVTNAASERGDALVAMSTVDNNRQAEIRIARRLPGGAFGAPERLALGKTAGQDRLDSQAGYSAAGEAILTWAVKGPKSADPFALWAAIAPPGAPFGAPQKVAAIDRDTAYALTVGADGRALAVFTSDERLVVAERAPGGAFGAPAVLAKTVDPLGSQPVAILRPDGGAVVAWTSPLTAGLTARTRERAGAFGPAIALVRPQKLGSVAVMVQQRFIGGYSADLGDATPHAALAADGRVMLTWSHLRLLQGVWRIVPGTALLDFAGGERETGTSGGPLRSPAVITPVLLADGSRAVAWSDNRADFDTGRVHLAREGSPDRADPPAPAVKVTLIGSRSLKSDSPLRLRVTCDAACDVYAQVAGQEESNTSTSLAAAGSRRIALSPNRRPLAPRKGGKLRIILRSGAPGAHRATARTLTLNVRRAPIAFPPRALGVSVALDGDDLVVRWHTATPASPDRYSVWAVDDQGEPVTSTDLRHGPKRTSFEARLEDARGAAKVIVYEIAARSADTRQTTVKVPG